MGSMVKDLEEALQAIVWESLPGKGEEAIFIPCGGPLALESLALTPTPAPAALPPALLFRWRTPNLPLSREAYLVLLLRASGEAFVLYAADAKAQAKGNLACLARLATPGAFNRFFRTFVEDNGAAYGVELFTSLPTLTINYRPELLPETTVYAAYRAFLDGPAARTMHDPWRHLQRQLRQLQSPRNIRLGKAHGGRQRDREEAITPPEKVRMLEHYLELTYKELRTGA